MVGAAGERESEDDLRYVGRARHYMPTSHYAKWYVVYVTTPF